ncbi:hypothetical protein BFU36_08105 [Sulfolobus sp. A20]|uniref:hypothetical protein n=1 Tax=Sulfolobaceae TaxID=118883 RepID=UPI000845E0E3|nr:MULTISPECIES: hypothetical protein [unclassified Sulfolobus]TRM74913.1 hypothetical protein DJ532_11630 [Sulfolobus sp. A20-N-F8]TRM76207.1 hypothetical protein DJ528_08585 [Sulfolobus sp. B5]TRM80952.1 hypothetical protein DJ524_05750 [Sulfolobus sp. D5]TRM82802.1 hypothetical protein DJ531_08345 [Sulfolobus sp. A20-N-F6]TRM86864.1 hypothetical protein DJ529_10155 [Sulfolobus sp. C3]TRM87585.1 hypothetical protein DJ521_03370 [Sulfolobus sp. E3]TRM93603.1 hypothetical protein DJ526_03580
MINKRGIIIMTIFAIIYSILELGMRWDPSAIPNSPYWMKSIFTPTVSLYFYRVLYILLFSFPSYLASQKLISLETIWYLIYGSTIEDIVYWILDFHLPYSWSWFYPVYYNVPIDDVIGILILVIMLLRKNLGKLKSV